MENKVLRIGTAEDVIKDIEKVTEVVINNIAKIIETLNEKLEMFDEMITLLLSSTETFKKIKDKKLVVLIEESIYGAMSVSNTIIGLMNDIKAQLWAYLSYLHAYNDATKSIKQNEKLDYFR